MECRKERILVSADGAFPLFSYRLWKKNLLFMWKMENCRLLSLVFAGFVSLAMKKLYPDKNYPMITGVPPRPGKLHKKGWDQIKELCWYLKNLYGFKTGTFLARVDSEQQKKLDRAGRINKRGSSYVLAEDCSCLPEELVLLDDVYTTGVTAESCSALLKAAGVRKIQVITLFTVD